MNIDWDWDLIVDSLPYLVAGLRYTFVVAISTMSIGLVLGLFLAIARGARLRVVRLPAMVFIDVFRGTPVLTQLLFFYVTVPLTTGVVWSPLTTGIVAFSLNVGAYCAETFRSGINSVSSLQAEGGLALGMTQQVMFRRVVLAQAVRRILPALGSIWVSLFKDTSLVALISVPDVLFRGREIAGLHFKTLELYTAVAAIYLVVSLPQAKLVDWLFLKYRTDE